ncbi:MAG: GIY-YIG nuclease family protein [bacterium]
MPYYVYIIECSNQAPYTGITNDLERRFRQHKEGKGGRYTAYNRGVKVRYSEVHATRSEAAKREAQIKSFSRTEKLALICG